MIEALRRRVGMVARSAADDAPLGISDAAIARGAVHECLASEEADGASVNAFALLLALKVARDRPILWLRTDAAMRRGGTVHAPGLAELGVDPARVLLTCCIDNKALLRAAHEAARCSGLGAALVETCGQASEIDLTATRRLTLAAEHSGATLLMSRVAADEAPSAARTRWRVAAAPSAPLEADAPGHPSFDIELLRDRGGRPPFAARVEWDRDRLAFREAPLPRGVAAVPAFGTVERAA